MEDVLIDKIKKTLGKSSMEESDIVYLTVKIRKLLYKLNLNSEYKTLKSYCDWALHDRISKNKTCQEILGEVEKQYKKAKTGNNFPDLALGIRFYELEEFKAELNLFLNRFEVQHNLLDEKTWINFRRLFVENLTDCPIEPSRKNKLIEKFVFKTPSTDNSISFEVKFSDNPTTFNGEILFILNNQNLARS